MQKKSKKNKRGGSMVNKGMVWGVERDPNSPSFGELVVGGPGQMPVMLWNTIGVKRHSKLTGVLKHGDFVTIKKVQHRHGNKYYNVECIVKHEGKEYLQQGWVSANLIKVENDKR